MLDGLKKWLDVAQVTDVGWTKMVGCRPGGRCWMD